MRYKVGDKVRIKSLDWYNENKDEYGVIYTSVNCNFYADRSKYCGKVFTIHRVFNNCYLVKEDNGNYNWTDEMIEGLVEEETKPKDMGEELRKCKSDFKYWVDNYIILPDGYVFKDENGNLIYANKIILEKKKKEYPKTYKECCKVLSLGEDGRLYTKGYKASLIQDFQKLLICRDAYWKIAGNEMGLGEPWEPGDNKVFGIIRQIGKIQKYNDFVGGSTILEFPTEEMRDAFKENFKEEIEICKELL